MNKQKIVVAFSGGGRTLDNLICAGKRADTPFYVGAAISSREDCKGVDIAKAHNLELFIGAFTGKEALATEERLAHWLDQVKPHWIALGGFLKPFPLKHSYSDKVINIHPSLLPDFGGKGMYGARVHEAVVKSNCEQSGATIHFVSEEYDRGAIIAQVTVDARDIDAKTLADRVFFAECQLYPQVLKLLCEQKLPLPKGGIYRYNLEEDPCKRN